MAFNPFDPFSAFKNNFFDGYQFGDLTKSVMGIHNDQASGLSMSGDDPFSQLGNLISGQTDFDRNMQLAAQEHGWSREDMDLQNVFTAEREDLAYARNKQDAQDLMAWQEKMANSQYQRGVADLKAAGLNPWLAAGGASAAVPSGQMAGATSASSAGISPINLPESKIWANTSQSIKTVLSNVMSILLIGKMFG